MLKLGDQETLVSKAEEGTDTLTPTDRDRQTCPGMYTEQLSLDPQPFFTLRLTGTQRLPTRQVYTSRHRCTHTQMLLPVLALTAWGPEARLGWLHLLQMHCTQKGPAR